MAITNPERGEIGISVKDKRYTLKLSMNAAVAIERKIGKGIGELLREAGALNFEAVRHIMWMLLQKYHADEFRTEETVGDWIDDAGGVAVFLTTLASIAEVNQDSANPPTTHAH